MDGPDAALNCTRCGPPAGQSYLMTDSVSADFRFGYDSSKARRTPKSEP